MTRKTLTAEDFPIAENCPDLIKGARGKSLDEITLDAIVSGDVTMEDLRITADALLQQAEVARSVHRTSLAQNFERASEMTRLPQSVVMEVYELLRPGRASEKQTLLDVASRMRDEFQAGELASFIEEAADVYDRRGLFVSRY